MNHPRMLRLLLRVIGGTSLLAIVPVLMPGSWMAPIGHAMGVATIPTDPVVGYLARSTSAFYAMLGAMLLVCSTDLERFRPIIRFTGISAVVFGAMLIGIDLREGMPLWWTIAEGPFNIAFGLVLLALNHGTDSAA